MRRATHEDDERAAREIAHAIMRMDNTFDARQITMTSTANTW
jgi:hypothetical protein